MTLEIKNLHVEVEDKKIIKDVSITIKPGEIVTLMGPNGSGKSTLAQTIMGNPKYTITKGTIKLDNKDITKKPANERAKEGVFLSFQYPEEIEGVTVLNFLRTAYQAKFGKISVVDFYNLLKEKMTELHIDKEFIKRYLNVGFSGGEKKKLEILQLAILNPKYAILDETDSGTDIDALRTIAEGINKMHKETDMGILIITHYTNILKHIPSDRVIVMQNGKIVKEDTIDMAHKIQEEGFKVIETPKIKESEITKALRTVKDPELDVDIVTLGLVYNVEETDEEVKITMTLTSPMCPFGPQIIEQAKKAAETATKKTVDVDLTFEPLWKPTDEVKAMLGV